MYTSLIYIVKDSASEDGMVKTSILQLKIIVKTVLYLKQFVQLESFQVNWNIYYQRYQKILDSEFHSSFSNLTLIILVDDRLWVNFAQTMKFSKHINKQ